MCVALAMFAIAMVAPAHAAGYASAAASSSSSSSSSSSGSSSSSSGGAAAAMPVPRAKWRSSWGRVDFRESSASGSHYAPAARRQDAAAAVLFGLRELVFLMGDELPGPKRAALRVWLATLALLFPDARARAALADLRDFVVAHDNLRRPAWEAKLASGWVLGGFGSAPVWGPCGGGVQYNNPPNGAKFTCSQWTLFHLLGAAAAELRGAGAEGAPGVGATLLAARAAGLAKRGHSSSGSTGSTADVISAAALLMQAIHDWVHEFFSCSYCRRHFLHMWSAGAFGRARVGDDTRAAQVWLWRTHNAVNVRLAAERQGGSARPRGDAAVRRAAKRGPGFSWGLDVQWPFGDDCAPRACTTTTGAAAAGGGAGRGGAGGGGRWDLDGVLAHLRASYWSDTWDFDAPPATAAAAAAGGRGGGGDVAGGTASLSSYVDEAAGAMGGGGGAGRVTTEDEAQEGALGLQVGVLSALALLILFVVARKRKVRPLR